MRRFIFAALLFSLVPGAAVFARPQRTDLISGVSVSPAFFNPSIGQRETIHFTARRAGTTDVTILDRDRFVIRRLPTEKIVAGANTVTWDGRDDKGTVVPDEAYNIRIAFRSPHGASVYDPSKGFHPHLYDMPATSYARRSGELTYTLKEPCRVHIQAGEAVMDPKTGHPEGPVLKTVVDRAPRIAGAVVERWNGYDESGTVFIPALPHFAVAIAAQSLPENSILTVGNRFETFAQYALAARKAADTQPRHTYAVRPMNHIGLNALEDRAAPVLLRSNAVWDAGLRTWDASGGLHLSTSLAEPQAQYFLSADTEVGVFVDRALYSQKRASSGQAVFDIPAANLSPGRHVVAVNWVSGHGPVAVNSMWVEEASEASRNAKASR